MAYTYRGTKITGMSVTAKKFPKSGIKNASKGQTYFNKSTGHVYKCTDGGKAKDAKWKYLRTDIAKKPTVAVSGLGAPVRENNSRKMKATWKTPAAMVDEKKGNRATALEIDWYLGIAGKDPKKVVKTGNEKLTESTINLSNLTIGNKTYKRTDFYPLENKPKLNYVTIKVTSKNAKGRGASEKATREFLTPRKPTISAFSFDAETGEVSCTIDTDAGDDYHERYDTRYKMTVYYSDTKETKTIHDTSTTLTSKTIVFDDAYYASRSYEDYAKVTVQAWARGYKGNSDVAERVFYVSYPSQASIDDVQVSSKDSTGKCTIYVNTHSTAEHPVDRVKLEYLANSDYAEANLIPGDASWEQTEILDDATCKALAMSVSNLIPDRGKYTWLRLKTFHANETVLYRYSQYWRVTDLETPAATAADDKIKILSATAGADGRSAVIELVWDDGEIPSTGTELSWSEEEDSWKSTKNPNDYEFTWSDGPRTIDGTTWGGSATITIKELDEASKYFVKARRYSEGDETTYSEYSNSATVVTSEKPESVTATADRYVPKGSGLNVYWTFAGNGLQREWQIVDSNGIILANGEGSLGSTQIPADRLIAFAEDGDIEFTVQVSTGSGFVVSESKKVTIIEPPTLEITNSSLVHAHEEVERNFSGEIVTFEPREEEFVKSLKVPLEPVQAGSGTPSPDNVRPITGWTGCGVNVSGKNIFATYDSLSWTPSVTKNTDGTLSVVGSRTTNGAYEIGSVSLKANITYTMKASGSADLYFQMRDANGNVVASAGINDGSYTPTSDEIATIRLFARANITFNTVLYPQIETGVTSTTYEPNNGQTYSVSWQDEAGTVYGGTLDVVSGVLTAYPYYASYNGETLIGPWVSSMDEYIEGRTPTTGAQVVDFGGTPTTYQLDPVQVALFIGEQNNIWNNVDITELKLAEVTLDEDQLQTNDLSLSFKSNKVCDIKLIVTSQGAVGQFPQGILRQTAGDTVHSNVYVPVWNESNDEFATTINLPIALDFWDKASYTLSAVAIDRQTGLKSAEVGFSFPVAWAHQAPSIEPLETYTLSTDITVSDNKNYYEYDSETEVYAVIEPVGTENPHDEGWYEVTITNYVTLTPIDEMDDSGFHHQAVQIDLTPPPNAETNDVYDIYRMTGDGAQLIGQSFPQTYVATDEYAPFGEDLTNHYRIAVRTADGDVEFSDIEYVLEGEGIRLDWAEGFIEYSYSIGIGDSYKKDVDVRKHLDGSIGAYWNRGVERTGSLNTDAIKILQQDDIELTRRLGRYTGPVFVRTREGTAFEADVQISNLSSKNIAVMSIAIDATEVDLTEEFMLPTPFNLDEGEQ